MSDDKARTYVAPGDELEGWIAGTWRSYSPSPADPPSALAPGSLSRFLSRRDGQPGWLVLTSTAIIVIGGNQLNGGPDKALFALTRDVALHLVGRRSNKLAFGRAALEVSKPDLAGAVTLATPGPVVASDEGWPYERLAIRPPILTPAIAAGYLAPGDELHGIISGRWGVNAGDVASAAKVAAASWVLTAGRVIVIQTSCVPGTFGWLVFSKWAALVIGAAPRDGAPGPVLTAITRDVLPPLTGTAQNNWRFANRTLTVSEADLGEARALLATPPPAHDWPEGTPWPYEPYAEPTRPGQWTPAPGARPEPPRDAPLTGIADLFSRPPEPEPDNSGAT